MFLPVGAGTAWKKYQEPKLLGKQSGAGAACKVVRSQTREQLKNIQLPIPAMYVQLNGNLRKQNIYA